MWVGVCQCGVMGEGRCHVKGVVCVCLLCVLCETMMGVEGGWLGRYSLFV